jgi:sugar-specific transcriptional regulator TrmB
MRIESSEKMGIDEQKDTDTLIALGLNSTQAKVYLALLRLGQTKARAIWKTSKVNRQDIYRLLNELERKNLVEKLLTTPAEFRALPIQDGLTSLLRERAQELDNLTERAKQLIVSLATQQNEHEITEEFEINLVSNKKAYVRRLEQAVVTTQESIDIIDSFDNCWHRQENDFELITTLIEKGVKFRHILNRPKEGQKLSKVLDKSQNRNEMVEVRFIPKEPIATIRIDDGKRLEISATAKCPRPEDTPTIYSDSPCLVGILQDYFERLWKEAIEDKKIYCKKPRRTSHATKRLEHTRTAKSATIKQIQV